MDSIWLVISLLQLQMDPLGHGLTALCSVTPTGSSTRPRLCSDSCAAIQLQQNLQHDGQRQQTHSDCRVSYTVAGGDTEQRLQVSFEQCLFFNSESGFTWPGSANGTVVLQLAACSEAGQSCIKLQLLYAQLQDINVSAALGADVNHDVRTQMPAVSGAILQDVSVQFHAATAEEPDTGGKRTQLWRGISPVNPSLLGRRAVLRRPSTGDYVR